MRGVCRVQLDPVARGDAGDGNASGADGAVEPKVPSHWHSCWENCRGSKSPQPNSCMKAQGDECL